MLKVKSIRKRKASVEVHTAAAVYSLPFSAFPRFAYCTASEVEKFRIVQDAIFWPEIHMLVELETVGNYPATARNSQGRFTAAA